MHSESTLLDPVEDVHWFSLPEPPPPRLLLELEPAYRVFFSNLADFLLLSSVPSYDLVSQPAPFWDDVFIPNGAPWLGLLESAFWHTIFILLPVFLLQGWFPRQIEIQPMSAAHIIYYRPDPAFPAHGSSPPMARVPAKPTSLSPQALRVVPQRIVRQPPILPPDLAAVTRPAQPPAPLSSPRLPAAPLAAVSAPRRQGSALGVAVIAPAPNVEQAAAMRSSGLRVVVVPPAPQIGHAGRPGASLGSGKIQPIAPAPELGAVSARRGMASPAVGAIAPAPMLQRDSLRRSLLGSANAGNKGQTTGSDGDLMHVLVVPPAPKLTINQGSSSRSGGAGIGGGGAAVVPPAPALSGSWAKGGREDAAGTGTGAKGRGASGGLLGAGSTVVPPAPTLGSARNLGHGGGGSFGDGSGLAVVPPPPSVGEDGKFARVGAGGLLDGSGSAVPPAPSMEGANGLNGRGGAAAGDAISSGASPPSAAGGTDGSDSDSSANGAVEVVPLHIVGLAFAMPSTSFGSSYEVYIAEKELAGHKKLLIKLVYWFLPYQQRLSETHPDITKMYKLRVTRDRACDESLLHMSQSSDGQTYPGPQLPAAALQADSASQNVPLPCYRTTADDYRKAATHR